MLITITGVTQEFTKNGAEYLKIKGTTDKGTETTKSVFDNLKEKWGLLIEGNTVEVKVEKKGQFWNVVDIASVKEQVEKLPPGKADMSAMEHSAEQGKTAEAKMQEKINQEITAYDHAKNKSMAISYVKDIIVALVNTGNVKGTDLADTVWGKMQERADQIVEWMEK